MNAESWIANLDVVKTKWRPFQEEITALVLNGPYPDGEKMTYLSAHICGKTQTIIVKNLFGGNKVHSRDMGWVGARLGLFGISIRKSF